MISTVRGVLVVSTLRRGRWALPALAMLLVASRPVLAEKLSKEDEQWLKQVQVLILPEEEQAFRELAAEDRSEFRNVFWARRNPGGPTAEENPAREDFEKARAEANERFKRYRADSDCTQILLLLGEPSTERSAARPIVQGTGGIATEDRIVRQWIYSELEGERLPPGGLVVGFDESCHMNEATKRRLWEALQPRRASQRVVNPAIEIRLDARGRLVPLADLLSPSTATQALLSPRQDFPIDDDVVFMRAASGETALLGLLQGRLSDATPGSALKMGVRAEVLSDTGDVVSSTERQLSVQPAPDGSFVAAYGLMSRPGSFTLRAGVVEPDSQRRATVGHSVDVPEYASNKLSGSTLMFLEKVEPVTDASDDDPLAPFVMGPYRLVPRVGRSFHRNETMLLVCSYYGSKADAVTGNARILGSLGILQDGKLVAKRMEQSVDMVDGTLAFGPLPLTAYEPGRYEAELRIKDGFSKQETTVRGEFEVTP